MVMVWLEGGQGEVRGTPPPHLDPPPTDPPDCEPLPEPPPPRGLRPTSTGGGGVAYKSEETAPPVPCLQLRDELARHPAPQSSHRLLHPAQDT